MNISKDYNIVSAIQKGNTTIKLCYTCIQAIQSRGEKLRIGQLLPEGKCDWCDEYNDELYDCSWKE